MHTYIPTYPPPLYIISAASLLRTKWTKQVLGICSHTYQNSTSKGMWGNYLNHNPAFLQTVTHIHQRVPKKLPNATEVPKAKGTSNDLNRVRENNLNHIQHVSEPYLKCTKEYKRQNTKRFEFVTWNPSWFCVLDGKWRPQRMVFPHPPARLHDTYHMEQRTYDATSGATSHFLPSGQQYTSDSTAPLCHQLSLLAECLLPPALYHPASIPTLVQLCMHTYEAT